MHDIANGWVWLGFSIFLVIALSADNFLLKDKFSRPHESMRAALFWTLVWVASALIFNILLWLYLDITVDRATANAVGLNFFTGYLIEKSLSVDNLFVFYLIFQQFRIPPNYQQRVFSYGIWGAIVMRLLVILVGTWLVTQFHWVLYLMGAFLLLTGIKMLFAVEKQRDLADTMVFRLLKRFFRVTHELHQERFFVCENKLWFVTPLFIALVFIEISDLIFAMDSIPAIFAITRDPFIVWSSNIFAILGLRAMYFLLACAVAKLALLKYGIALILVYIGFDMLIAPWLLIPVGFSLAVIVCILLLFTVISVRCASKE